MKRTSILMALALGATAGCKSTAEGQEASSASKPASQPAEAAGGTQKAGPPPEGLAVATFAGGCFWCMEPPFEKLEGVKEAYSGYAGGSEPHPEYKQVARGKTGHTETVRVVYDPDAISYEQLLDVFWRNIDPTDAEGQFVDRGQQYRPEIFYHSPAQKAEAEKSKATLEASGRFDAPIRVAITEAGDFWLAEDYHQDFYEKSTAHYQRYRRGSGRDRFIERHWGEKME